MIKFKKNGDMEIKLNISADLRLDKVFLRQGHYAIEDLVNSIENYNLNIADSVICSRSVSQRKKEDVFKKYNYKCAKCNCTSEEKRLEIDHILPLSEGGNNDLSNLQVLCKTCHRLKHGD